MANIKEELLSLMEEKGEEPIAVLLVLDSETQKKFILPFGYTGKEYESFMSQVDLEYDNEVGNQELFGTVWFKDGSWAERIDSDGAEWWEIKQVRNPPNAEMYQFTIAAEYLPALLQKYGALNIEIVKYLPKKVIKGDPFSLYNQDTVLGKAYRVRLRWVEGLTKTQLQKSLPWEAKVRGFKAL